MKSVYVVTMWSGGRPAKKWKTDAPPQLMSAGTGVEFLNVATRLKVQVIGSISIEEFESGKEEIELGTSHGTQHRPRRNVSLIEDDDPNGEDDKSRENDLKRLF